MSYLGSDFDLHFPTVDDVKNELKALGRGALLYKVYISQAFCHVKVCPGDYDLLGLHWDGVYHDTCLRSGRIMEVKSSSISVRQFIMLCIMRLY